MSPAALAPVAQHYRDAFEQVRRNLPGSSARRAAAMARFAELGFPAAREEAWKYTNLRRLEARRFIPAAADTALTFNNLPPALAANRLVLENGRLRPAFTAGSLASTGFTVTQLDANGDDSVSASVLRVLAGGGTERFAALNAALAVDPLLLECNARSEELLQITILATGDATTISNPRLAVRMAPGSRARLLLDFCDDGKVERFVNSVLDVELGAGAELTVYRAQRHGERAFHIDRVDAQVGANASFIMRDSQLGGSLSRLDLNVVLAGRAAQTQLTGVFLADGARHLDTHIHVAHRGVETTSLQDYRGIAANKGRAVFTGKAVVHGGAQKSNARQSSRNLLLTPGAEIDTKPELEIYADDVQCSHGATTGQLDPDALFYLRARGLSEPAARSALTRAFAGAVLALVDVAPLANLVHDELDRRLVRLLEVTEA